MVEQDWSSYITDEVTQIQQGRSNAIQKARDHMKIWKCDLFVMWCEKTDLAGGVFLVWRVSGNGKWCTPAKRQGLNSRRGIGSNHEERLRNSWETVKLRVIWVAQCCWLSERFWQWCCAVGASVLDSATYVLCVMSDFGLRNVTNFQLQGKYI